MQEIKKLNAKNLSLLPKKVATPAYDRSKIKTGIVHIGVGGFHRAHEAFYTDQILHCHGVTDWGICGIALLDTDRKIQVTFPNCMVDRITPVTTPSDIENLKDICGIEDAWPVVCEPFIQWVIEDNYSNGRPDWESVGVQFVRDVGPYEKMKIRLLNAGHSLLGFLGSLNGCSTIDETVKIPLFRSFLREFMDYEVTPVLGKIEGIRLEDYKDSLIQRFGNPYIKDQLSRICLESSAKIPKFLLPTIKEQLERGGPIKRGTVIVAAWCRYLELAGTPGFNFEIQDKMGVVLQDNARASITGDPLAFLKIEAVFDDMVHSRRFVDTYLPIIDSIRKYGVEQTIRKLEQLVI